MAGSRDVRAVCPASCPEPQVVGRAVEREIFPAAGVADIAGVFGISSHAGFHGQWSDPVPLCPFLSSCQGHEDAWQDFTHVVGVLGYGVHGSASRTALGHDDGDGKEAHTGTVPDTHMGAADYCCSDCRIICRCCLMGGIPLCSR